MELFKLPRKLGNTPAGDEIVANVGRFGPYVKYGAKYASLKTDDPYEITPERALEVIREKEVADANRLILDFPDAGIQVLNGRYGPYITDKQRNAKIPKDKDPKSLNLEECQALLAAAPVRTFGKWGRKKAANNDAAAKPGAAGVGKAAAGAKKAAASAKAPAVRLAAKGKKATVDKKAPGKITGAAKSKTPVKSKKSSAKKKP
jgi:DNA topoisomerase-1